MSHVIVGVVCFVGGLATMFFVYRNNKKWFESREAELQALPEQIKQLLRARGVHV